MVITEVEGVVPPKKWDQLRSDYQPMTGVLEPTVVRTYLLQDTDNPEIWKIATVWASREALEKYRTLVETPGAFVLFRQVGVEPIRKILDVNDHAENNDIATGRK